jgi:aspartate/tyrosine/aromatic aminotransferase
MDMDFGKSVLAKSLVLKKTGKDVNDIAKILAGDDELGWNYGVGNILDGKGKPIDSSLVLQETSKIELVDNCKKAQYVNSAKYMDIFKKAVLSWQQIPEKYWDNIILVLPSDSGTGAVDVGLRFTSWLYPDLKTLAVEKLGWPVYKTSAKINNLKFAEFDYNWQLVSGRSRLPLIQSGPLNSTGKVDNLRDWEEVAELARSSNRPVLLDRAYSGFAYADLILNKRNITLEKIMNLEYNSMLSPFLENGVETVIAISPTKCFGTFNLRPAGILLIYSPTKQRLRKLNIFLNQRIRVRGCAFENPITRAFVISFIEYNMTFLREHFTILQRTVNANQNWKKLCKNEDLKNLFGANYAGIFRNFPVKPGSEVKIYDQHIYPVFSKHKNDTMCRVNTTGLPDDKDLAKKHISAFEEIMI